MLHDCALMFKNTQCCHSNIALIRKYRGSFLYKGNTVTVISRAFARIGAMFYSEGLFGRSSLPHPSHSPYPIRISVNTPQIFDVSWSSAECAWLLSYQRRKFWGSRNNFLDWVRSSWLSPLSFHGSCVTQLAVPSCILSVTNSCDKWLFFVSLSR